MVRINKLRERERERERDQKIFGEEVQLNHAVTSLMRYSMKLIKKEIDRSKYVLTSRLRGVLCQVYI